jgi:YggT family protein
MLIIFIRVILSWFSSADFGRVGDILYTITDPYLNWFRRFGFLRQGYIDLSPIAAMAALSLVNQALNTLSTLGRLSLGIILAIVLSSVWSAVSFILGFCAVILGLSLVAFLTNQNIHSPFWKVVTSISQPISYRTNRIIFRSRIVLYRTGLITSIVLLVVIIILVGYLINLAAFLLIRLPI